MSPRIRTELMKMSFGRPFVVVVSWRTVMIQLPPNEV